MIIERVESVEERKMAPHKGRGDMFLRFLLHDFQNYKEDLDNYNYKSKGNHYLWNFISYVRIPVGVTSGYHKHDGNDEIFYILEGEAKIRSGRKANKVIKGDIILTVDGESHEIYDVESELHFIAIEVLSYDSAIKKS